MITFFMHTWELIVIINTTCESCNIIVVLYNRRQQLSINFALVKYPHSLYHLIRYLQ